MKIFREAKINERMELFEHGFREWSKKRTFEKYCEDNAKEDAYGTRYVIEEDGRIVSSLILLHLSPIAGRQVFGIGSVVTPKDYTHKGYASYLLSECLRQHIQDDDVVFLYSDVIASFYERYGFRVLPMKLQREQDSIGMVLCDDSFLELLVKEGIDVIPEHF